MSASSELDFFPGGVQRGRGALIAVAIELGWHDEGPSDVPEPEHYESYPIEWALTAAVQAHTVRDGYRFAAVIQAVTPGEWSVLGVATPESPESGHGEARLREVLDVHSHQYLGKFFDYGQALLVGEAFITLARPPGELCGCGELHPEADVEAEAIAEVEVSAESAPP